MNKEELFDRNKKMVLSTIRLIEGLPNNLSNNIFSRQLIRCSSSVGANYRAACRAKSNADFINKLKIVEEELDETCYFLDLIKEINKEKSTIIELIEKEANELLAIYVASIKTMRLKNVQTRKP